jgi:hypothetical protein
VKKTETHTLRTKLPCKQKLLMRQQQLTTDIEQQLAIALLFGHLVISTKPFRRTPGITRIRQMTQCTIECQQILGAETARKPFPRQAQAVTHRRYTHARQCLA